MAAYPIRKSSHPPRRSSHPPRTSGLWPAAEGKPRSVPPADQPRIEVELNVYTEQPNPRWLLGKSSAEALLAQLPEESSLLPSTEGGYCGFTIRIDSSGSKRNVQVFHNTELERWLLNSGRFCLPAEVTQLVENHLVYPTAADQRPPGFATPLLHDSGLDAAAGIAALASPLRVARAASLLRAPLRADA